MTELLMPLATSGQEKLEKELNEKKNEFSQLASAFEQLKNEFEKNLQVARIKVGSKKKKRKLLQKTKKNF